MARWSGAVGTLTLGPQMWDVVPELGLCPFRQQGLIKVSDWLPALLVDETARRFAFIGRWNLQHGKKKKKSVLHVGQGEKRLGKSSTTFLFAIFFLMFPLLYVQRLGRVQIGPPGPPSIPPDRGEENST